jgi:glucose-1-phosphate thymidylyltransferase
MVLIMAASMLPVVIVDLLTIIPRGTAMTCRGIILAGGRGTRLYPITRSTSKQLLPIYDKPMIYYPLATLMESGVREVLVICMPHQMQGYRDVLGDGSRWGVEISYAAQEKPRGLSEALIIGEEFIGGDPAALILGDNIFHGNVRFDPDALPPGKQAEVFACRVNDPERYGVVEFDGSGEPVRIVEKPSEPLSDWAVTGLYLYRENASRYAKSLKPSSRGELEITDLNQTYLDRGELHVSKLDEGVAWLDSGTFESLLGAANYVEVIQKRTGMPVGCPDTVAKKKGWI